MNNSSYSVPRPGLIRRLQVAIAVACLALVSCGGGAELLFVPFFSFGFTGTFNNATVSMFLKDSDDCTTEGTLPASANMSIEGVKVSDITGSYEERDVVITLDTPPAGFAKTYDGQFVDRDTIAFKPRDTAGTAFTVKRVDVGAVLPTCPA